jgi:hypothetical protein
MNNPALPHAKTVGAVPAPLNAKENREKKVSPLQAA